MAKQTITFTVNAVEHIADAKMAKALAEVLIEKMNEKYPFIESIDFTIRPTVRTPATAGEVHGDCGQMVPYGGAFLHQC